MHCERGGFGRAVAAAGFAWAMTFAVWMPVAQAQTLTPEQRAEQQAKQELIRQEERARQLLEQQQTRPDVRLPRPVLPMDVGQLPPDELPCFLIRHIELVGEEAQRFIKDLAAAHRAPDGAADVATGRCLGARGVNAVMARVQNAIVARGFVTTRVLAAPQDLKNGTLQLTVVPGRIRQIRFAEGTSPRATHFNALPAQPGDVLNLRDIEQALENFKRVPSAEADIQITPAVGADAQPGQSDVVIVWKQHRPLRLTLSADDAGTRATGKRQGSATLAYDHGLALNDLFYVNVNQDLGGGEAGNRGTRGHSAHYSVPYGYWLLALTTGRNHYHQAVAGANQTLIFSGESTTSDVRLTRGLYRDAVRKSALALRLWTRSSKNFIDDTEVEVQRRRVSGWELGANHREFMGRATLEANLAYRRGTGAFGALPAPEQAFGEGTARLKLISADAQYVMPFSAAAQALRYSATWRAQWNRTALVPQDRFAIGGRYTVRGFDGETTLAAERGWLLRNDLGWALAGQELYLGLDYGQVGGASSATLSGKHLAGTALGVRGSTKGLSYDVFAATPLSKPSGLQAPSPVTGFNLSWTY